MLNENCTNTAIEKDALEALRIVADKEGMKLYALLSKIVREWLEKQKQD